MMEPRNVSSQPKRERLLVAMMMIAFGTGMMLIFTWRNFSPFYESQGIYIFGYSIGVILIVIALIWFLARYLQRGRILGDNLRPEVTYLQELVQRSDSELAAVKEELIRVREHVREPPGSPEKIKEEELPHGMKAEAARVRELARQSDSRVDETRHRLIKEIATLERRGTFNLIWGAAITLLGLGVLGYFIWANHASPFDWQTMGAFIPRLSMVLLIEGFAFFFLHLYRWGLHQVKYFHNELTTVEGRALALRMAATSENAELLQMAIAAFAGLDRNATSSLAIEPRTRMQASSAPES